MRQSKVCNFVWNYGNLSIYSILRGGAKRGARNPYSPTCGYGFRTCRQRVRPEVAGPMTGSPAIRNDDDYSILMPFALMTRPHLSYCAFMKVPVLPVCRRPALRRS